MKLTEDNIFISITDPSMKKDFFSKKIDRNFEVALFALPRFIGADWRVYASKVKKVFKRYPVKRHIHGPFYDLAYESKDEDIVKISRKKISRGLEIAGILGAEHMVVHSTFNPLNPDPKYKSYWLEKSAVFWRGMVSLAKKNKCMIVIENIFDPSPDMIKKLIREVDSPFFKACLDIGHANIFSDIPVEEWVRGLKKDMYHIHIHDNDGKVDYHWGIGKGNINFDGFFEELGRIRHIPAFTIEVKTLKDVEASLKYLRKNNLAEGI